jgi:hypothetical protein
MKFYAGYDFSAGSSAAHSWCWRRVRSTSDRYRPARGNQGGREEQRPLPDSCDAANIILFDHLLGNGAGCSYLVNTWRFLPSVSLITLSVRCAV